MCIPQKETGSCCSSVSSDYNDMVNNAARHGILAEYCTCICHCLCSFFIYITVCQFSPIYGKEITRETFNTYCRWHTSVEFLLWFGTPRRVPYVYVQRTGWANWEKQPVAEWTHLRVPFCILLLAGVHWSYLPVRTTTPSALLWGVEDRDGHHKIWQSLWQSIFQGHGEVHLKYEKHQGRVILFLH